MPKKENTQEPEDKGQEEETQQSPEEQDELFSEGFKDATKDTKPDPEATDEDKEEEGEKDSGKSDKDKSGKGKESDGSKGKGSTAKEPEEEGEGKEEGEAKKEIEERAKRLKQIMEGEEEEEEEEEKPKKKAAKKAPKKAAKPEPEEEEEEEESEEDILKGVKLSEAEKDFIEDMPEVGGILSKILKKALKNLDSSGELPEEVMEALQNQDKQIAVLRTQVVLTKLVPDWEDLVYDGNKLLDSGERKPNEDFWNWLKEQPDLYKALANSDNPKDNAAVLKFYKEEQAKKQLDKVDQENKDKLKKTQDLHSHSANDKKTAKKEKRGIEEDDFGGHFAEAGKKAAKGQL